MRWSRWSVVALVAVLVPACGAGTVSGARSFAASSSSVASSSSPLSSRSSAAATSPTGECLALVEQPWASSTVTGDPIADARGNRLGGLPGGGSARVANVTDYGTPESYVDTNPGILRPDVRIESMHKDGYDDGVVVEYTSSEGTFDVTVLAFTNNDAAIDYSKVHLRDACEAVRSAARLPGGQGLVYVRNDGLAKAVFVSGNTEISICGCFQASDPAAAAADAAENIHHQLTDAST